MYRILIENFTKYDQLTFDQVRERLSQLPDGIIPRIERFDTLDLRWEYVPLSRFYTLENAV